MSHTEVIVITGACGNLGRELARVFQKQGSTLILVDRDPSKLTAAFGADTPARLLVACDLSEPVDAHGAIRSALDRTGPASVLCNAAGGFCMGEAVHETTDATWDRMMTLNVKTLLH